MAITSRGRMAGMARAMSQLQTAHQLLIRFWLFEIDVVDLHVFANDAHFVTFFNIYT